MSAKIILIGRITRPEKLTSKAGKTYVTFGLAVTVRKKTDGIWGSDTNWYNITSFSAWDENSAMQDKAIVQVVGDCVYEKDASNVLRLNIVSTSISIIVWPKKEAVAVAEKTEAADTEDSPEEIADIEDDLPF